MKRFDTDASAPLEQRLRTHFLHRFGPPPHPDTVWARLAPHLGERANLGPELRSASGSAHAAPGRQLASGPALHMRLADHAPAGPPPDRSRLSRYTPLVAVLLIAVASAGLFGVFGAGLQRVRPLGVSTASTTPHGTPYGTGTAHLNPVVPPCQGFDTLKEVCHTPEPTVTPDQGGLWLQQVQMLSSDDGWAIGQNAILHYSAGQWSVAFTAPGATLTGLSMDAPDDGWVVGAGGMVHYTGGRWTSVALPPVLQPNEELASIYMLSPTEGWAGALANTSQGEEQAGDGVILHEVAGRWSRVIVRDGNGTPVGIRSIDMISPMEGWATALGGSDADAFLHYANGQWTPVGPPGPGLVSLSMISATDGWAVGSFARSPVFARYTGGRWVEIYPTVAGASGTLRPGGLFGVSMLPSGEGWAVGAHGTILHYANGTWTLVESDTLPDLYAVQMLAPDEGWAVGYRGTILHYANGTWTPQPGP